MLIVGLSACRVFRLRFSVLGSKRSHKLLSGAQRDGGGEGRSRTRNCIEKASSPESVASLAALCAAAAANWELGIEMDAIQALIWWHHRPMGASASGGQWQLKGGGRSLGQGGMCSWTLSVAAASAHCSLINDAPYGRNGPERLGNNPQSGSSLAYSGLCCPVARSRVSLPI